MVSQNRYLHFENIDMKAPEIHSQCSQCGREFTAQVKAGERVDDVLLRIRDEFNTHLCSS